jgi:hypothetical protein
MWDVVVVLLFPTTTSRGASGRGLPCTCARGLCLRVCGRAYFVCLCKWGLLVGIGAAAAKAVKKQNTHKQPLRVWASVSRPPPQHTHTPPAVAVRARNDRRRRPSCCCCLLPRRFFPKVFFWGVWPAAAAPFQVDRLTTELPADFSHAHTNTYRYVPDLDRSNDDDDQRPWGNNNGRRDSTPRCCTPRSRRGVSLPPPAPAHSKR